MRLYYRPDHPKASERGFVRAEDLHDEVEQSYAINSGVMAGRFYENLQFPDGTPINSRRQYSGYLKAKNATHMGDFTGTWQKAAKEREERARGGTREERQERKQDLIRAMQMPRRKP